MKKNELVHYHALLKQVSTDFVERGIVTREEFAEYEELGISPVALRASRDQHEEAVLLLSEILSVAAGREAEERASEEPTAGESPSTDEHALTTW
ncbi:hypothetical protein SAMN04488063_1501 [Halopelagius inordinatus]|uniref:Metal-binding protein n=1 Tax=Halopelagius inordinatus TaxID=553467 RepID=A0A1I2PG26_9EURY|nr:UPF0058 family protein [Halopelagius inordinatus]SFG12596.1 hypothetical protein SAMN04488063_1501 [Halopelagius inordinatus]